MDVTFHWYLRDFRFYFVLLIRICCGTLSDTSSLTCRVACGEDNDETGDVPPEKKTLAVTTTIITELMYTHAYAYAQSI